MKRCQKIVLLTLTLLLIVGMTYLTAQEKAPAAVPLAATPQAQTQVDLAWKDLEIAQLHLQIAVQQALGDMEKGAYYDFQQRKFFKLAPQPAPAKAPATKPKE